MKHVPIHVVMFQWLHFDKFQNLPHKYHVLNYAKVNVLNPSYLVSMFEQSCCKNSKSFNNCWLACCKCYNMFQFMMHLFSIMFAFRLWYEQWKIETFIGFKPSFTISKCTYQLKRIVYPNAICQNII